MGFDRLGQVDERPKDLMLGFDAYQDQAATTAIFPSVLIEDADGGLHRASWVYPALGLANEAGEVLGKLKKVMRDLGGDLSNETRAALRDELGDVLWYLSALATELGLSLYSIATKNLDKLADRAKRGTLKGAGDKR